MGIYVLGFCRQRGFSIEGINIVQRHDYDPATSLTSRIYLDIQLPPDLLEKYKFAVIRSAKQFKVKKTLEHPPVFEVMTGVAVPA
jgi:putative redox protein